MPTQEKKECSNCEKKFILQTKEQEFCCTECQEEYELTLDEDLAISEDLI